MRWLVNKKSHTARMMCMLLMLWASMVIVEWRMQRYALHPPVFLYAQLCDEEKSDGVKKASAFLWCGFASMIANRHWFGLLQATTHIVQQQYGQHLYAVADHITDLDPHFNVVYRYAAQLLLVQADRADLALRLLKKSLSSPSNADDWRIYFLCSFAQRSVSDDAAAHRYLQVASQQPRFFVEVLKMQRPLTPDWVC